METTKLEGLGTRLLYILSPVHCMSVCQCLVDGIPYSRSCLWLGGCVVADNLKEWDVLVSTYMFGQHLSIQEIVFPLLSGFTVGKCDPVCSIIPSCLYPHLSLLAVCDEIWKARNGALDCVLCVKV